MTLLGIPLNRMYSYLVFLKNLHKVTPEDHPDNKVLEELNPQWEDYMKILQKQLEVANLKMKNGNENMLKNNEQINSLMKSEKLVEEFDIKLSKISTEMRSIFLFKEVFCIGRKSQIESPTLLEKVWLMDLDKKDFSVRLSTMETLFRVYFNSLESMEKFVELFTKLIEEQVNKGTVKKDSKRRYVIQQYEFGTYSG